MVSDEQEKKQDETHELDAECHRCGAALVAQRCRSQYSRWYAGWDAVCVSCHSSYFGADQLPGLRAKAKRYAEGERHP